MGASGSKQLQAICFRLRQGLLVAEHHPGGVVLDLSKGDETSPFLFSLLPRNREALRVNVNGWFKILKEDALSPPPTKELCGASVSIVARVVRGLLLTKNDAHQVVRTGSVIPLAHLRCDLVVGLGYDLIQSNF